MCAKRSPLRAQRCAARRQRLMVVRAPPDTPRTWQRCCASKSEEGGRVFIRKKNLIKKHIKVINVACSKAFKKGSNTPVCGPVKHTD